MDNTTSATTIAPKINPETLQWFLTTSIFFLLILCLGLHYYLAWDYKRQIKTSTKDTINIMLDENEDGEAQYLVSIVTSTNYRHAPTSVTTLHLIGSRFPGRIHDIHPMTTRDILQPLSLLKVVVKEDVDLDPIIAIVLKTNNSGSDPTWRCKQIIVRNLTTNSAWLFLMNNEEIGFSKCYNCVPYKEILSFPVVFKHRLRLENSHGLRAYSGIYSGNPLSAYKGRQRMFLSVATHFFTLNFAMISYSFIFQYHAFRSTTTGASRPFGTGQHTLTSLWFFRMVPAAFLSGIVGSTISYFVNKLFREKGRYEIGLSETDHYVATALREAVETRMKQLRNMKNAVENIPFADIILRESKANGLIFLHTSEHNLPPTFDYVLPDGTDMTPAQAREKQRHIFTGKNAKRDRRSILSSVHTPEVLTNVKTLTNFLSKRNRKKSVPVFIVPYTKPGESHSIIPSHVSRTEISILVPKFVLPDYRKPFGFQHQKIIPGLLPGEMDPDFFKRPEYKPVAAWVVATTFFLGGFLGCLTLLSLDIANIFAYNGIYVLIIIATFLMAISVQLIFFETAKLYLVAFILAKNDIRLYLYAEQELLLLQDVRFQYRQTLLSTLFRSTLENILHSSYLLRKNNNNEMMRSDAT